MCHHFSGKNGVKNGMVYHFWNFRVYSRDRHYRTLYRGSIYRSAIYYIKLEYFKCKAFLLDTIKTYYNTVLLLYLLTPGKGRGLHFRTSVRLPERAYLMFPHVFHHFEFDTHFDKTLKNQAFHHFSHHQKSPLSTLKSHQNHWK